MLCPTCRSFIMRCGCRAVAEACRPEPRSLTVVDGECVLGHALSGAPFDLPALRRRVEGMNSVKPLAWVHVEHPRVLGSSITREGFRLYGATSLAGPLRRSSHGEAVSLRIRAAIAQMTLRRAERLILVATDMLYAPAVRIALTMEHAVRVVSADANTCELYSALRGHPLVDHIPIAQLCIP